MKRELPRCGSTRTVTGWAGGSTPSAHASGEGNRERRARLDALGLHGPAWQTPRAFSIDEDLITVTRDRHLEGVVAKRLDAT